MSDAISLMPTLTAQGLEAVFNHSNSGLEASITEVALGSAAYTVPVDSDGLATQTALRNPQQRVPIADGQRVSGQQIDLSFVVDSLVVDSTEANSSQVNNTPANNTQDGSTSDNGYWVRELGFYLDDGTLFAVWSDPDKTLAWKSDSVPLIIGLELVLTALPADSVTVQASAAPLQLMMTREIASLSEAIIRLQQQQLKQLKQQNTLDSTTAHMLKSNSELADQLLRLQRQQLKQQQTVHVSLDSLVGIGTTNPSAKLHLGGGSGLGRPPAEVEMKQLTLDPPSHGGGPWNVYTRDIPVYAYLDIRYRENDLFTIRHDGNVGIGTTSPSAKLEVQGNVKITGAITPSAGNSENNGIMFPKDPGGGRGDAAWIRYYPRSGEATTLEIGTSNDSNDHIALIPSGNVGIGTTSPSYKLHVNGTAYATGTAGSLSDARHKQSIKSIASNVLEIIEKLRPVTFKWKEPKDSGMQGQQFGFIAQEVEKILPEAVLTQEDNEQTKGIKYSTLIPILTKAIQDLTDKNEQLIARVEALEKRL